MNLIQISEQLKDVPDQFLVKEIQNPTGSYPAYLVVSELTRRKRMREGALKEEPQTTVSEDLMGITAAPEAAESTLGSARQQMAQMPPQMAPQMPAQLAGQMPQMPQMMSGGGLVAFEKGGPIRAFDGMFTGDYTQTNEPTMRGLMPSIKDYFTGGVYNEMKELEKAGLTDAQISQMTPEQRTQKVKEIRQAVVPAAVAAAPVAAAPKPAPRTNTAPGAAPGAAPAPAAAPTGIRAAAPQLPIDLQALLDTAKNEKGIPSEQERATARAEGAREFQEKLPFRQKEILERRIAERTEELQRDKKMSFNDALLAAGAAVLSAPGGGTKWMGEGLKAFNQTMIEGKRDMRKAQQLIEQSEMDLAQAQMLRDQGEFAAADRKEEKAFTRAATAKQLANSDAALGLQAYKARAEAAEQESKARYLDAYAKLLSEGGAGAATAAAKAAGEGIDIGRLTMAEARAEQELKGEGNKNPTKAQIRERAAFYYPAIKNIPAPQPFIRGLEAPATLAPGT